MNRFATGLSALSVCLLVLSAFGADDEQKKGKKGKRDPAAMFKKLDADGNGKVTKQEFKALLDRIKDKVGADKAAKIGEFMERRFKAADKNNDGALDSKEFSSFGRRPGGKGKGPGNFGGKINREELQKKIKELKDSGATPEQIREKIREYLKSKGVNPKKKKRPAKP